LLGKSRLRDKVDAPPACGGNGAIVNNDVTSCFQRSLVTSLPIFQRAFDGASCSSGNAR
jgi:hypothetical protein